MEVQLAGGGEVGQGIARRVEAGSETVIHGTGYIVRIGLDVLPRPACAVAVVPLSIEPRAITVDLHLQLARLEVRQIRQPLLVGRRAKAPAGVLLLRLQLAPKVGVLLPHGV